MGFWLNIYSQFEDWKGPQNVTGVVSESSNYISMWNQLNKKSELKNCDTGNTRNAILKRSMSDWDKIEVLSEAHSNDSTLDTVHTLH